MRIFGWEIGRAKQLSPVPDYRGGWRRILEPYSGAWQQNVEEKQSTVLCYPTLYACLNRISQDIGKLPFQLKSVDSNGIWQPVQNAAYSPVLRKPNHYQTQQQFRESWILSKLIQGNTYALKGRDNRGVVTSLYILDPCNVVPLVADSGDVYYRLNFPTSANLLPEKYPGNELVVPASEIIHDRLNTFHHPLIGVPPLCAANMPACKNLKILKDATAFFSNGANPGGILTAPAGMSEADADAIKAYWNTNFSGDNAGKVAVIGADMKFTAFAFKAADSQLVEQLRYSDEQICQPFGIPPFKIGIGSIPAGLGVDSINQLYYSDALQAHIEAMEALLDEGLAISPPLGVEMDLEPLLRMDVGKQTEVIAKQVAGKLITPDEGRKRLGYGPTGGGDTIWAQQQDFPLATLRDRLPPDQKPEPATPPPPPEPSSAASDENKALAAEVWQLKAIQATREALNA